MDISQEKKALREKARETRVKLATAASDHPRSLLRHASALPLAKNSTVGGYKALLGEADPRLLIEELRAQGHAIVYPRVSSKSEALTFHVQPPGRNFVKGSFGVPEPQADWPRSDPSVLLIPLLAFDTQGYRLGYGGGYYDRTLEELRRRGSVTAIGVAYAGQEVASLPREATDEKLDMVVTEAGIRRFG
ncbi:MAG: 5-formyltetrahydrofolate cyclo-ligase [Proteobacteria bacterium]|nr:5-formyltetrahydrofolate cyclo-ligase [Pseudomonadota bacterium]